MATTRKWDPYAVLDDIKVPAWVTSPVSPVKSPGIFDDMYAARERHRKESEANMQDMLNAEKVYDMIARSRLETGLSDYVKSNPSAGLDTIYGELGKQSAGVGDVETMLKGMEAQRSFQKQEEIERKNKENERATAISRVIQAANYGGPEAAAIVARELGIEDLGSAFPEKVRAPKAAKSPHFQKFVDSSGVEHTVDINDPDSVAEIKAKTSSGDWNLQSGQKRDDFLSRVIGGPVQKDESRLVPTGKKTKDGRDVFKDPRTGRNVVKAVKGQNKSIGGAPRG